jgi:CheY-like chemotaxis protein
MKILIVDDEYDSIEAFRRCISDAYPTPEHNVVWCTNVNRAAGILKQPEPPDLIILDVMMPRNDESDGDGIDEGSVDVDAGIDFLSEQGAWILGNNIPFIVLTNRRSTEVKLMVAELGFLKTDDLGRPELTTDGNPVVVHFPTGQYFVFTKLIDITPRMLVGRISELLAAYRPL